jgi:phage shock protein A
MGIFDRMGKVIQSNLNSLLEKAEDDKKLILLNLDEMDDQIKAGHQEVVQAVAAEKQLRKKADDLKADVERWDKRAELALKSGDEALAREALKQKKRVSAEADQVEQARGEQRNAALKMKEELERMKTKLSELKLRKGSIIARAQQSRGAGAEQLGSKGGSSAFDNFRRMEEKIEGREAEGSAMAEVEEALGKGEKAEDLESRFRDLERQVGGKGDGPAAGGGSEIDEELAALKKRIRV